MRIFSIVGWSNSGKTRLISRLICFFKTRGDTVVVLKNVPHGYSLQPEGKDSVRFLDAGADLVYLSGQAEIVRLKRRTKPGHVLDTILPELGHTDVLILEGLTGKGTPVIEVWDPKKNPRLKISMALLSAVVSAEKINLPLPCFHPDDIEHIVKFMEEKPNE